MSTTTDTRTVVSSIVIAATPEQIWQAITDPEQIPAGTPTEEQVSGGSTLILSALKTLLETGKPLPLG